MLNRVPGIYLVVRELYSTKKYWCASMAEVVEPTCKAVLGSISGMLTGSVRLNLFYLFGHRAMGQTDLWVVPLLSCILRRARKWL
jgi:hypothetical protein